LKDDILCLGFIISSRHLLLFWFGFVVAKHAMAPSSLLVLLQQRRRQHVVTFLFLVSFVTKKVTPTNYRPFLLFWFCCNERAKEEKDNNFHHLL